jgi:hypothetical protein
LTITVARKPLGEGTVAKNVLKYGSGSLNIDGSRIRTADTVTTNARGESGRKDTRNVYDGGDRKPILESHQTEGQKLGRWPANMILQHKAGCRKVGVKQVKVVGCTGQGSGGVVVPFGQVDGYRDFTSYASGGTEMVDAWECVEGCLVAGLDEQSVAMGMHSAGHAREAARTGEALGMFGMPSGTGNRFGDTGGASRFFKQVGGEL